MLSPNGREVDGRIDSPDARRPQFSLERAGTGFVVRCGGPLTSDDLYAGYLEVVSEAGGRGDCRCLVDLREGDVASIHAESLQVFHRGILGLLERLRCGRAEIGFLVATTVAFGVIRALQGWSGDGPVVVRLFRDPDEAMVWVCEGASGSDSVVNAQAHLGTTDHKEEAAPSIRRQ